MAYKPQLGRILGHVTDARKRRCKGSPVTSAIARLRRPAREWASLALVVVAAPLLLASRDAAPAGPNVEWPVEEFSEPSDIVYHPGRGTLFVVGDEGDIGEVDLDGKLLRQFHFGGDLESITVDPSTGLLYVVRESHEILFEVRPDNFRILRRFTIDRSFQGDPNFLRRGGDGIEGITFVPDATHPDGGRFWAVNQFDPPVLVELAVALKTSKEKFQTARIARAIPVDYAPLSAVTWDPEYHEFLIVSALWKRVVVVDEAGNISGDVRIPAFMPEGIALLPGGDVVIAQDSGGLVSWKPSRDLFHDSAMVGPPAPSRPGDGKVAPKSREPELPVAFPTNVPSSEHR